MFNSTVCRLTFSICLASLILMHWHVLSGASTGYLNDDVFDDHLWERLKKEPKENLGYKPITKNLGSRVYSIVRDEVSFDTSLLVGTRDGVYRLSGENMTVTDQWNATKETGVQLTRLIMIDYNTQPNPSIISCGSNENGMCRLHNYTNLNVSQVIGDLGNPVNSVIYHDRSTVITSLVSSKTIFVTYQKYLGEPLLQSPPFFPARILEIPASGRPTFRYARQENGFISEFNIHPNIKPHGWFDATEPYFVYDGYAYFSLTFPSNSNSSRIKRRLVRVSLYDLSFSSYEEIELMCKHEGRYFQILKAVYLESDTFGNSSQSFLVGSFMQATGNTPNIDGGSVICIYSMEAISQKFREQDSKCSSNSSFTWTDSTDLRKIFYKKSNICMSDSEKDEFNNNFCQIPVEHHGPVSKCPLESKAVWSSSSWIYSLAADQQGDNRIVFYREAGRIAKLVLPSDKAPYLTFKQSTLSGSIWSLVLSKEQRANKKANDSFVYYAVDDKVVKFPLTSCSIYRTCTSCLLSNDPLDCGWCGTHCAQRRECPKSAFSNETCPPMIYGFRPNSAPLAGGTTVEIRGQNFGWSTNGSLTIAGVKCPRKNIKHWDFNTIVVVVPPWKFEAVGPIQVSLSYPVSYITSYSNSTFYSFGTSISDSKFEYIYSETPLLKPTPLDVIGNPVIDSVDTQTARCSGFTPIIVKGSDFHSSQNITLEMEFTYFDDKKLKKTISKKRTNCRVDNTTEMTCFAPRCPFYLKPGKQHWAKPSLYKESLRISSPESYNWQITYLPDPNVNNLEEDTKVYIDDPVLELFGSDLHFGSQILISVGNWTCEVLPKQQERNLLCRIQFRDDFPVEGDSATVGYRLRENDELDSLGNVIFLYRARGQAVVAVLKKQWYIPVTTAIVILFFAIAIVYWKVVQRKSQRKEYQDGKHTELERSHESHVIRVTNEYHVNAVDDTQTPLMSAPLAVNDSLSNEALKLLEKNNKLIDKDRLILRDFIGSGHFGMVYKAELWDMNKEVTQKVAVKTLQISAPSQSELNVFIREALIMKDFCHPRVLHLIGVSFLDSMSPVVVTPFITNGDLLAFLRDDEKITTVSHLIAFAIEIAEGMEYLASQKYVHRDLAARNCLLDHFNHIKIADFGLSRDVYEKDYYRPEDRGLLPIKWMAPESLENSKFTTKSDVWSFGVTFWEIITRGLPPYSGIPAWHVINFLKAGDRLGKPDYCPAPIYELMTLCWSLCPNDRPTFTDILQQLHLRIQQIERKHSDEIIERKHVYVNVPKGPYYLHSEG